MHRLWKLLLCVVIAGGVTVSQQRYLVTPSQEIYSIGKETGGALGELLRLYPKAPASFCDPSPMYGFDPQIYNPQISFSFHHRDVCGQWYTIPVDATIDTLYFLTGASVGPDCDSIGQPCIDSTVYIRIFSSNITASSGPGVRPGPYHPPCVTWGYWINTNDNDQGISPFRDEATDTTWQPTNLMFGDSAPSFPPMGDLLWGGNGYPVHLSANSVIKVSMADLGPLQVHKGDAMFVAILFPSMSHLALTQEIPLLLLANTDKAPYPSRNWKFYEHDSGMSLACSGIDSSMVRRGWAARGGLTGDSTSTLAYDIWYTFTPTANIPPVILSVQQLHTTTSTDPRQVTAQILDCDFEMPSRAGVASAFIAYHLDSDSVWSTTPMTGVLDQFTGTLPGIQAFHSLTYRTVAMDSTGMADSSETHTYRVVSLNSTGWYRCDTVVTPTEANIAATGTVIDTSAWFLDPHAFLSGTPHRGDDGTAGPFTISGGFTFYGDTMHYAWVGVNGAIALSKTATDTIDVNTNGRFSDQFDIPYPQRHSRQDTSNSVKVPKAYIAPWWSDWITLQDSPRAQFGRIRRYDDGTKFIVEWDSIGVLFDIGAQQDVATFRVVLNKFDQTIEFQYDRIGAGGYDTLNLTGIQCDSNYHPVPGGEFPPYNFFNRHGYPVETHLRNGLTIRYVPVVATVAASDGWNLLSLPVVYENDSVSFLFQSRCSSAFRYTCSGSYEPILAIEPGEGFWIKMCGASTLPIIGRCLTELPITVCPGWNMIGSICAPVSTSSIIADPGTGISPVTTYFGYSGGYQVAGTISPGFGYFVRAVAAGTIRLGGNGAMKAGSRRDDLAEMSRITISESPRLSQTLYIGTGSFDPDRYLMPPPMPDAGLDVRFASGRMVETIPDYLGPKDKRSYPVEINANRYPITISWNISASEDRHLLTLTTEEGKALAIMQGNGKLSLSDPAIKRLNIVVSASIAIPRAYALAQNFPNPFNPSTTVQYQLPSDSHVRILIYNILGQLVATLADGNEPAGYKTVEWNATAVGSGVYFCRMEASSIADPSKSFSGVRKLVLMK